MKCGLHERHDGGLCSKQSREKNKKLLQAMHVTELNLTEIIYSSLLDASFCMLIIGRQIYCSVLKSELLYGGCDFLGVCVLGMYMNFSLQTRRKHSFL